MKKTIVTAVFFLISGTAMAFAAAGSAPASGQVSADFSGAVGDSVAKGMGVVAISAGAPVAAVGMSAHQVGAALIDGGSQTLCERSKGCRSLPITDETVLGTMAPNEALKARRQAEEF
ncbi:MAG: hypothetical protein KF765_05840 [Parvibaculaceae bacterium]|nr:hypothetical protein [Parvibaculaceae bacterium]